MPEMRRACAMARTARPHVLFMTFLLMCPVTACGSSAAACLRSAAARQDELAEAAAVCRLIVTGTLEDVLDADKRAALPRMDLLRLAAILPKYRRVAAAHPVRVISGAWQHVHVFGFLAASAAQAAVAMPMDLALTRQVPV